MCCHSTARDHEIFFPGELDPVLGDEYTDEAFAGAGGEELEAPDFGDGDEGEEPDFGDDEGTVGHNGFSKW